MRVALVVVLSLAAAWLALGWFEIVPLPFGWQPRGELASGEGRTIDAAGTEDDAAAALSGRSGARKPLATDESAAPPAPAEVRGSVGHGALLRGRVVAGGEPAVPIAGATVRLLRPHAVTAYLKTPSEGRWDVLEARSGADGRFAFVDVRPARGYVVRARSGTGASASTERFAVVERQVKDFGDLVLGGVAMLEGRVTDGAGRPIADAQVAVSWRVESFLGIVLAEPDLMPEIETRTVTDAEGRYRLAPLEPGVKTLVVASSSRGGRVSSVTVGENVTVHDVTLAAEGVIAGRVTWDDDKPAAGVRVFAVEAKMTDASVHSAVSATDGAFRIEHVDGDDFRLSAFVPGLPVRPTGSIAPGTLDVALRLPLTGALSGRVVRKTDGRPLERFGILLEPQGAEDMTARALRRMLATAVGATEFAAFPPDGRFQVPVVAEGTYVIVVQAAGFPEGRSQPVKVPARGTGDAGTISLVDGHGVAGIVLGASGEPLARAEVRLLAAVEGDTQFDFEGLEWDEGASLGTAPDAFTDETGRFTLGPQTPGVYVLRVTHPFAVPHVEEGLDLKHAPRHDLELRLKAAGTVRTTLQDVDGTPVAKEGVWLARPDGYAEWRETDAQGRCLFESVPAGACIVRWNQAFNYRLVRDVRQAADDGARTRAWEALKGDTPLTVVRAGEEAAVAIRLGPRVDVTLNVRPWADEVKSVRDVWFVDRVAGTWLTSQRQEDGTFRVRATPGTYDVFAIPEPQGWDGHKQFKAVEVPEGRSHTVDLGR